MAIVASSASAYGNVFGHFSPAGPYTQQGTLTLTHDGQTKQCSVVLTAANFHAAGSSPCTGGGLLVFNNVYEFPVWNGGNPKASFAQHFGTESPWGTLNEFGFQVPVVNGDATTSTRLVFSNTRLGTTAGKPVYATGELVITTTGGALVTVTP